MQNDFAIEDSVTKFHGTISHSPPNIILNGKGMVSSTLLSLIFAGLGILLQAAILVITGVTTYHWKWPKEGASLVAPYSYPCFISGTFAVSIGLLMCSRVIDGSTDKHNFALEDNGKEYRILRIQKAKAVNDQNFGSFAIFNEKGNTRLRMSRLNKRSYGALATTGSCIAVFGFVVQYVGLRALHV